MSEHASSLLLALYFSVSYCLGSETLEFNDKLYENRFQTIEEMVNYLSDKTFVTEHLSISLTTEDDIGQLSKLFIGKDWLGMYMDKDEIPTNEDDAKTRLIQRKLTKINTKEDNVEHDRCFCTIKLRNQNTCIGQLGVTFFPKNNNEYCLIWADYWIGKQYSNKKYMSEICPPMYKFFFETYEPGITLQLYFVVLKDNSHSHKLAEKICCHINKNYKYIYREDEIVFRGNQATYRELWKTKEGTPSEYQEGNLFLPQVHQGEGQKKKDQRLCSCCPCR
ncbi:MAG: GNAT family N-acetyltransferase [Cytophagales bacterium]|nr:GNAT family N-acetyltransferase [Cytophagales bacterium]